MKTSFPVFCTLGTSSNNQDNRREYKHQWYLARRERHIAAVKVGRAAKSEEKKARSSGGFDPEMSSPYKDTDEIPDIRQPLERERADSMEAIRLRLLWAVSAGGDEGTVAKTAIAVIKFAEGVGRHWTDRSLRCLHLRLSQAEGLTTARFEAARDAVSHDLFIPL